MWDARWEIFQSDNFSVWPQLYWMPRGGSHRNNKLHYLIGTNKCRRASGQLHGGFGNFSKYSS